MSHSRSSTPYSSGVADDSGILGANGEHSDSLGELSKAVVRQLSIDPNTPTIDEPNPFFQEPNRSTYESLTGSAVLSALSEQSTMLGIQPNHRVLQQLQKQTDPFGVDMPIWNTPDSAMNSSWSNSEMVHPSGVETNHDASPDSIEAAQCLSPSAEICQINSAATSRPSVGGSAVWPRSACSTPTAQLLDQRGLAIGQRNLSADNLMPLDHRRGFAPSTADSAYNSPGSSQQTSFVASTPSPLSQYQQYSWSRMNAGGRHVEPSASFSIADGPQLAEHRAKTAAKPVNGVAARPQAATGSSSLAIEARKQPRAEMQQVLKFGKYGEQVHEFKEPSGLALLRCPDMGNAEVLLVCDSNNSRILKYDLEGRYMGVFADQRNIKFPNAIRVNPLHGHVIVTERNPNNRIVVFNDRGEKQMIIGQGQHHNPRSLAVDRAGQIILMESKGTERRNRDERVWPPSVSIYRYWMVQGRPFGASRPGGRHQHNWDSERIRYFSLQKHVVFPMRVCLNPSQPNLIYIVDNSDSKVKVFDYDGQHKFDWCWLNQSISVNYPVSILFRDNGTLLGVDNHYHFNLTEITGDGSQVLRGWSSKSKHSSVLDVILLDDYRVAMSCADFKVYVYSLADESNGHGTHGFAGQAHLAGLTGHSLGALGQAQLVGAQQTAPGIYSHGTSTFPTQPTFPTQSTDAFQLYAMHAAAMARMPAPPVHVGTSPAPATTTPMPTAPIPAPMVGGAAGGGAGPGPAPSLLYDLAQ